MKALGLAGMGLVLVTGCYSGLGSKPTLSGGADGADDGVDDGAGDGADDGDDGGADDGGGEPGEAPQFVPLSGARRLTMVEYVDTVRDLLGVEATTAAAVLPSPDFIPFDNDYTTQTESAALIVGLESLARSISADVVADPARLQALIDCPADGPTDAACFETFLEDFGRRVLRRPPTADEIAGWSAFGMAEAEAANRPSLAIEVALQSFLQHPEFLYRIDYGTPEPGTDDVVRLDDWAVASRLSFLLWGIGPDDQLLDAASAGTLNNPEGVRQAALRMLDDERARLRVQRFHAMWMGYEFLPIGGDIGIGMRAETGALLDKIIFEEQRPWAEIFESEETFVSATLAEHYGLAAPVAPEGDWVDYADSGRGGILSHGTFLSNGFKAGDTSPTLRGLAVRTMLLCQDVPPPPPVVNDNVPGADESPEGPCKVDRYAAHRTEASCAACHQLMDGIGFGLENYDQMGQFRASDPGYPECEIDGEGDVPGVGTFNGPAELGTLLVNDPALSRCLVQQAYRFAVGRTELDSVDIDLINASIERVGLDDFEFRELLLDHVSTPQFGFARHDQGAE